MPALKYKPVSPLWTANGNIEDEKLRESFRQHVAGKMFPCVAAKAALGLGSIDIFVATHIACPADDEAILDFLYHFVDRLRKEPVKFRSAVVIFRDETPVTEPDFDRFLWRRLQALADADRRQYRHDPRVSSDPHSPDFSFSLKEEAFYIIGMHPESSRPARRSVRSALVFNAHAQFEQLRKEGKYAALQTVIRKRDVLYSGSVNPMLSDFGDGSEAIQYSGRRQESGWSCPLQLNESSHGDHFPA